MRNTEVRAYVDILHTLAQPLHATGKLVVASFGQQPNGEAICPKVEHFAVGEVSAMTDAIMRLGAEQHRNVYVPLAVVRKDLGIRKKASEDDVIAVLGSVADFDDDDAEIYLTRLPMQPTMALQTSQGRYQAFFIFKEPVARDKAKQAAIALCDYAGCDFGTKDISHVWRVPGTRNWPNKKKVIEGRSTEPQEVSYAMELSEDKFVDFSKLEKALSQILKPLPQPTEVKPQAGHDASVQSYVVQLPQTLKEKIMQPTPVGGRSDVIYAVTAALVQYGLSDVDIETLIRSYPEGIGEKYAERHDLGAEIARIRGKVAAKSNDAITIMNFRHAVLTVGNKVAILTEKTNPVTGFELQLLRQTDIRLLYANQIMQVGDKHVNLADWWIKHPQRRSYEGIVFDPTERAEGNYYNLFRGFPIRPGSGICKLFLQHLLENICQSNQEHFRYLMAWMADAVQKPGSRPGVALVLRGKEGTGKGFFVTEFGRLFGVHFLPVTNSKHLTGNFNAHLENKLLVFADEAFWAGEKQAEGVLKSMITEDTLLLERKGFDAIKVQNHIRLVIATNSEWAVPAGMEARRFFVLDVGDSHRQDVEYFKAIADEVNNGGREALMQLLLQPDWLTVDLRRVPQTEALLHNKLQTLPAIERWWYEVLVRGSLGGAKNWPPIIECEELYQEFTLQSAFAPGRVRPPSSEVGRKLKELTREKIVRKRKQENKQRDYIYTLPTLTECRAAFAGVINYLIDWGEE